MLHILAQAADQTADQTTQTVTTGTIYSWVNPYMAVALIFALAGAFFVSIYILRRRKQETPTE